MAAKTTTTTFAKVSVNAVTHSVPTMAVAFLDHNGDPANEIGLKQGNTLPPVDAVFTDEDGDPVNLAGAKVTFCMGRDVRERMEIVDASNGRVRYEWQEKDTRRVGTWNAEFVVEWASGIVQRVPSKGFLTVRIHRSLCEE